MTNQGSLAPRRPVAKHLPAYHSWEVGPSIHPHTHPHFLLPRVQTWQGMVKGRALEQSGSEVDS